MFALKGDARGMTLVEIVVVLAIMGILAALAVPSFIKYLPGVKLKGDTRNVASVSRLARMRAVAEGAQYGIFFDDDHTPAQFILFQDVNGNEEFDISADEVIFSQELYGKTLFRRVNFANDVAIFKADGSSNGGWVSLGLEERSDSLMVDILPSTGRVKVIK
ncbi:GspH/FimT family pseudopilin [bacterium]|nr:GspH/FimT family pseudopilin [bacterium]